MPTCVAFWRYLLWQWGWIQWSLEGPFQSLQFCDLLVNVWSLVTGVNKMYYPNIAAYWQAAFCFTWGCTVRFRKPTCSSAGWTLPTWVMVITEAYRAVGVGWTCGEHLVQTWKHTMLKGCLKRHFWYSSPKFDSVWLVLPFFALKAKFSRAEPNGWSSSCLQIPVGHTHFFLRSFGAGQGHISSGHK